MATSIDRIAISAIDTADDRALHRWLAVRNQVDPRPLTPAAFRAELTAATEHLELIATLDGADVGAAEGGWGAIAQESKTTFLVGWVVPGARRHGVGSALIDRLVAFAMGHGMTTGRSVALDGDEGALRFAARYGLEQVGRGQDGRLDLTPTHATSSAVPPAAIMIASFAERPDLEASVYHLDVLVAPEIPTLALEPTPSFAAWQAQTSGDPGFLPELSLIALRGDVVVGAIQMYDNGEGAAFIGMTAVHPDARRQGIARALKVELAARAVRAGWHRLETFNDGSNERMRGLNAELGYTYLPVMAMLKGPLATR
jgi:GNAT superfamily N-acetyltransferase